MKKKVKEPEGIKMLKEAFKVFDDTGKGSLTRLKKISQWKKYKYFCKFAQHPKKFIVPQSDDTKNTHNVTLGRVELIVMH